MTVLFTVQTKDDLSQEQFITEEDSKVTLQMCLNRAGCCFFICQLNKSLGMAKPKPDTSPVVNILWADGLDRLTAGDS